MKNEPRYAQKIDWLQDQCPIKATVDVVGGLWKPLILFYLLDQPKRFSALRKDIPSVTAQMLTLQLRQLEADGIVDRTIHAEIPVHVEHALPPYRRTLSSLLPRMPKCSHQPLNRHTPQ